MTDIFDTTDALTKLRSAQKVVEHLETLYIPRIEASMSENNHTNWVYYDFPSWTRNVHDEIQSVSDRMQSERISENEYSEESLYINYLMTGCYSIEAVLEFYVGLELWKEHNEEYEHLDEIASLLLKMSEDFRKPIGSKVRFDRFNTWRQSITQASRRNNSLRGDLDLYVLEAVVMAAPADMFSFDEWRNGITAYLEGQVIDLY